MKMISKTRGGKRLKKFFQDARRNGGLTPRARQVVQEKRDANDDNSRADQ